MRANFLGARPSNLLLHAAIPSLRAECSKNGLCGVASATPPRRFPALPLSLRPPRARDGHYSDDLLAESRLFPRLFRSLAEESPDFAGAPDVGLTGPAEGPALPAPPGK